MLNAKVVCLAASCALTAGCDPFPCAPTNDYRALLVNAPGVMSPGTGEFVGTINPNQLILFYELSWTGLGSSAVAAHIHGPGQWPNTAPTLVNFAALPAGTINDTLMLAISGLARGTIDLESAVTPAVSGDSLRRLFESGMVYADVHTGADSAVEMRANISRLNKRCF